MDNDFRSVSLIHLQQQASLLDLDDVLSHENLHEHLGQNHHAQRITHGPTDKSVEVI